MKNATNHNTFACPSHRLRRLLAGCLSTLAASMAISCGVGPTNTAENCQFEVFTANVATLASRKRVELSGNMPPSCETLTRENTGKLVVAVRLVGEENEDIRLAAVQAGNRSKQFDPDLANLKVGSLDAAFSSTSEPSWAVPWADAPDVFEVALLAPLATTDENLPRKASIKLSL